jgi:Mrp family chromosome partitioning ATPase
LVDAVILVASLGETSKQQLHDAKKKLENYDAKLIGAIINKVEMSEFKRHIKDFDYFKNKKMQLDYE